MLNKQTSILWLDLGNTRLKYWLTDTAFTVLAQGSELHLQSPTDLLRGLIGLFAKYNASRVCVSSVLSATDNVRVQRILARLNIPVHFAVVHSVYKTLSTDYDTTKLGIDRWLQLLALSDLPEKLCVVGCGTAMTIDLLDKGHHSGGYIVPSLYLQRAALTQGTRKIKIEKSPFQGISVGINTHQAVHHGILLGLLALLEKVQRQEAERQMVLTGGDAELFKQLLLEHSADIDIHVKPELLLQGLQCYFKEAI